MTRRPVLAISALSFALLLSACASDASGGDAPSETATPPPPSENGDPAARERAQAWLDAAVLPPGAVRSDVRIGQFTSYVGWPCRPVEELEGFWTIPKATVRDTANWLIAHPTASLVSTAPGPIPDHLEMNETAVGFIPSVGAQEGIVYTIAATDQGVAVRAEVAALAEDAVCEELPDGGTWGAPGQG